ncbi:MAG: dTMP kinase [Nitrospirae bacterium]|nr:dTMP kinase [Nitrospirota bacterium]
MKGKLISFEGIEGTGKTTQARLLYQFLISKGYDVVLTEEPGSTKIGSKIRGILLSPDHQGMTSTTELLLYYADRAQHLNELIMPSIERGAIVITDRFTDSTYAYQGYGRGINLNLIDSIDLIATERLRPDITILLDLDVETGLNRNRGINKTDRLELEDLEFHKRVRKGYLELAQKETQRIKVVDASLSIIEVQNIIVNIITEFFGKNI